MRKKTPWNSDVSLLMQMLDVIIAVGYSHSQKRVMLKREELQPIVDMPRDSLLRYDENDRVFPLEAVELQKFKTKHDIKISQAMIHTGPYSDELARSMNALAITLGRDIFFRNGAYSTATERGRAVLSHELTHIGQYDDKRIEGNTGIEKLEREAEYEEEKEAGISDPIIPIMVGDYIYRIKKSHLKQTAELTAKKLTRWLEERKLLMESKEYLALLVRARDYEGERA